MIHELYIGSPENKLTFAGYSNISQNFQFINTSSTSTTSVITPTTTSSEQLQKTHGLQIMLNTNDTKK